MNNFATRVLQAPLVLAVLASGIYFLSDADKAMREVTTSAASVVSGAYAMMQTAEQQREQILLALAGIDKSILGAYAMMQTAEQQQREQIKIALAGIDNRLRNIGFAVLGCFAMMVVLCIASGPERKAPLRKLTVARPPNTTTTDASLEECFAEFNRTVACLGHGKFQIKADNERTKRFFSIMWPSDDASRMQADNMTMYHTPENYSVFSHGESWEIYTRNYAVKLGETEFHSVGLYHPHANYKTTFIVPHSPNFKAADIVRALDEMAASAGPKAVMIDSVESEAPCGAQAKPQPQPQPQLQEGKGKDEDEDVVLVGKTATA